MLSHDDIGNMCPSAMASLRSFISRFLSGIVYSHFNSHHPHDSVEIALTRVTNYLHVSRCLYGATESKIEGTVEII